MVNPGVQVIFAKLSKFGITTKIYMFMVKTPVPRLPAILASVNCPAQVPTAVDDCPHRVACHLDNLEAADETLYCDDVVHQCAQHAVVHAHI